MPYNATNFGVSQSWVEIPVLGLTSFVTWNPSFSQCVNKPIKVKQSHKRVHNIHNVYLGKLLGLKTVKYLFGNSQFDKY